MKKALVVIGLLVAGAILWATFRSDVVSAVHGFAHSINK